MDKNTKITKEDIKDTINALAQSFDDELANQSQEDLEKYWHFKWDADASDETNLYNFHDMLDLYSKHCRRWAVRQRGSCCVVEWVRDTYLMPKIQEFLELLSSNK